MVAWDTHLQKGEDINSFRWETTNPDLMLKTFSLNIPKVKPIIKPIHWSGFGWKFRHTHYQQVLLISCDILTFCCSIIIFMEHHHFFPNFISIHFSRFNHRVSWIHQLVDVSGTTVVATSPTPWLFNWWVSKAVAPGVPRPSLCPCRGGKIPWPSTGTTDGSRGWSSPRWSWSGLKRNISEGGWKNGDVIRVKNDGYNLSSQHGDLTIENGDWTHEQSIWQI